VLFAPVIEGAEHLAKNFDQMDRGEPLRHRRESDMSMKMIFTSETDSAMLAAPSRMRWIT